MILLLLGLLAAGACTPPAGEPPLTAWVVQVVDGDTVILADGRRLRYLGIDTLELNRGTAAEQRWAQEAREVNAALVHQRQVRLEYDKERYDQYQRLLAYVFTPDGCLVNAELLARGLARVMIKPPNVRYQALLVAQQQQALAARRGLWRELPPATEKNYWGNRQTWRFHRPNCPAAARISPGQRLIFATPRVAYETGYYPCRLCQP